MPFDIKINELALPYDNLNTDSKKYILYGKILLRLNNEPVPENKRNTISKKISSIYFKINAK